MLTPEQTIAEEAARAGGAIAARYFREGVAMRSKDVANLVSDADVEAEHAIAAVIKRAFPSHTILGEEAHEQGDATAEHLWIIDPIDGTNNFAHKIPHFAVSVAYYHAGVAQCGVIFNPVRDEWHSAARGQGAFHDGRQVHVEDATRLDEVIVGVGFYYDRSGWRTQAQADPRDSPVRHSLARPLHGRPRPLRSLLRIPIIPLGLCRRPPLRRRSRRKGDGRPRRRTPDRKIQHPRHQRQDSRGDARGCQTKTSQDLVGWARPTTN